MLVVLAERLAQIIEWFKSAAGYRIVESNWKVLDWPHNQLNRNNNSLISSKRTCSFPSTEIESITDLFPHLANWISSKDKVSFLWLTNLSGQEMKEELSQSLLSNDGQEVIVIGISYADAQSLSGCVRPKKGCQTLPRCKSYRLCKVDLASNPQDTLTPIVEKKSRTRTLYFSRHGESEYNVTGKVGGDADLSPRGFLYAKRLADFVNEKLRDCVDLRVWTSRLKRTIQTAHGIRAPQEHLATLNELDTGVCDGLTYEEIAERFPSEFAARDDDKYNYRYPEGESYHDLLLRVQPVLNRLHEEDNVLVIAHQAVLRCLLADLMNKEHQELPYIHAPLHTVMRLCFSADGDYRMELIPLQVDCVDTHRAKPRNCSRTRSAEEALVTVPAHF